MKDFQKYLKDTGYIAIQKGKSYQWYYDRLIKMGYPEDYAKNTATEQFDVWGK